MTDRAPYIKPVNECRISGRLVRDPEVKYLPSGKALALFTIANERSYKDKNDEWAKETAFIDCKAFGKPAKWISENFRKGANAVVSGRMSQESWEKDGQKRSKLVLVAFEVNYHGEPTPTPGYKPEPTGAPSDGLEFDTMEKDSIPF